LNRLRDGPLTCPQLQLLGRIRTDEEHLSLSRAIKAAVLVGVSEYRSEASPELKAFQDGLRGALRGNGRPDIVEVMALLHRFGILLTSFSHSEL
jgi:hypothetical protein